MWVLFSNDIVWSESCPLGLLSVYHREILFVVPAFAIPAAQTDDDDREEIEDERDKKGHFEGSWHVFFLVWIDCHLTWSISAVSRLTLSTSCIFNCTWVDHQCKLSVTTPWKIVSLAQSLFGYTTCLITDHTQWSQLLIYDLTLLAFESEKHLVIQCKFHEDSLSFKIRGLFAVTWRFPKVRGRPHLADAQITVSYQNTGQILVPRNVENCA